MKGKQSNSKRIDNQEASDVHQVLALKDELFPAIPSLPARRVAGRATASAGKRKHRRVDDKYGLLGLSCLRGKE